ncbi:TetR/AcrR family transcriptional regulator [Isoptericola hypogeus]|uniref:TetR/AcrR family transcriptional regulator n=1 Tax=Isoptericola hypogeus TaxID=300179 RepID=A0ABN2IT82_9MICO
MVRPARPEVRQLLIERAAGLLARREPVTLRGVVAGTGVSTMAVYTHFDGMPGLLGAVRQEGFSRLAGRLAAIPATDDPVGDAAAAGGAYAASARLSPELYTLMFDGSLPLPDSGAANATLEHLVSAVRRAVAGGRFDADVDPLGLAHQLWMLGHGACMLLATGVMPFEQVEPVVTSGLACLYQAAGDDAGLAGASVRSGWERGMTARA